MEELLLNVREAAQPFLKPQVYFIGVANLDAFAGESSSKWIFPHDRGLRMRAGHNESQKIVQALPFLLTCIRRLHSDYLNCAEYSPAVFVFFNDKGGP